MRLLLAGIVVIVWHVFTGQLALYRLRKAGFYMTPHEAFLEARLWEALCEDWHQLFHASTWKAGPSPTVKDNDETSKLSNYPAWRDWWAMKNEGVLHKEPWKFATSFGAPIRGVSV